MAKAYLGKISAIVTANTSDFNSKLNASAKEVRSFAAAMDSTLKSASSSAQASLRGIYTESQKVSRALQAAATTRLKFEGYDKKTFAELNAAVETFKRIQQASVAVNEPLVRAAQTIDKLSAKVQSAFEPAMASAQKSAEYLSAALARGGIVGEKSFERIRLKAEQAAQAADRFAEASQIASSGPRGNELAFAAPRVRDSLTASAAIRNQAARAPASLLEGGNVARDVQKLTSIDALIVKRRAEVEAGIALNIDTTKARASLDALLAVSEKVRASISAAITPASGGNRAADNEIALLQRREQAEKELEVRRAAAAQRAEDNEIARIQRRSQGEKEIEIARAAAAQRAEDNEIALIIRREQAAKNLESGRFRDEGKFSPFSAPDAGARRVRGLAGGDPPDTGTALGRSLDVGRQVDSIAQKIASTRQQIDALPEGLRTRMIPALQQALNTLVDVERLGARATADQLSRANKEAERLAQNTSRVQRGQNFSEQFGGRGTRGLELNLQDTSLRGYTAQLQILQQTLSKVSSAARGPALTSFNELRKAIANAAKNGTLDLASTRQELARLTTNAVNAAAAVGSISPGRLAGQLKRAGDIGRGAFRNLGLGIQQAIFAFDDFFSVTGGLDQRIRAAGNNISQLGFILGGTYGLAAGVAVSATSQLIVAFLNMQNAGVKTEDRLKALNETLSRQDSLVENLASAFSSLADEIGRIGFSKQGAEAAELAKNIEKIRKDQTEFSVGRAAAIDPEVLRQRGIISARERELQKTENPGQRILISGQLEEARRRERTRLREIENRPPRDAAFFAGAALRGRFNTALEAARTADNITRGDSLPGVQQQLDQERDRIFAEIRAAGGDRNSPESFDVARKELLRAEASLKERIEKQPTVAGFEVSPFGDELRDELRKVKASLIELESGAVNAANNLEIKVVEAATAAAKEIGLAQEKVARAIESGVLGSSKFEKELDALNQRLRDAVVDLADARKLEREDGVSSGASAKAKAQVDAIQAELKAKQAEVAAIDAARSSLDRFKAALDSVAAEAEANFQAAQGRANQAREADIGRGTASSAEARRRAEADLEQQRGARNRVDEEVARARARAQESPANVQLEQELAALRESLSGTNALPPGQREEMSASASRLERLAEQRIRDSVDNDPRVRAARDDSTLIEQRQQSALRGDQARMTPAQRAGEELAGQLADIRQSFDRQGQGQGAAAQDAQRRAAQDAMRQAAPAIFGMADQVQNAVLQGPSRAALQASDVTTMQGASELNRLIRGDDSAKNVDTVELQKQSKALEELVVIARANGAPAGVFN